MEGLKAWYSARSWPVKLVIWLVALVFAIDVVRAMFANSFAVFVISGLTFLGLLVLHVVRSGSDSDADIDQTLGSWGANVAAIAMVMTLLFGGVALASAVFGNDASEQRTASTL